MPPYVPLNTLIFLLIIFVGTSVTMLIRMYIEERRGKRHEDD